MITIPYITSEQVRANFSVFKLAIEKKMEATYGKHWQEIFPDNLTTESQLNFVYASIQVHILLTPTNQLTNLTRLSWFISKWTRDDLTAARKMVFQEDEQHIHGIDAVVVLLNAYVFLWNTSHEKSNENTREQSP